VFCRSLFILFLLTIVLSVLRCGFWLPLWYLKTLLFKYCIVHLWVNRKNWSILLGQFWKYYSDDFTIRPSVLLARHELLALPGHLSKPHGEVSWVYVAQSLVFCVVFRRSLFDLFPLVIVLSVLQISRLLITPLISSNLSCIAILTDFVFSTYTVFDF